MQQDRLKQTRCEPFQLNDLDILNPKLDNFWLDKVFTNIYQQLQGTESKKSNQ